MLSAALACRLTVQTAIAKQFSSVRYAVISPVDCRRNRFAKSSKTRHSYSAFTWHSTLPRRAHNEQFGRWYECKPDLHRY